MSKAGFLIRYPFNSVKREYAAIDSEQLNVINDINSVCLFLGPYRNLTTLTAALLALHPNCQVLNHGWQGILYNPNRNFLYRYSDEKFSNFCAFALKASSEPIEGQRGVILKSHAFRNNPQLKELYSKKYEGTLLKPAIQSLVWKESQRVTNFIRDFNVDLESLFKQNTKLRFIMPIRNPIEVTFSNIRSHHSSLLTKKPSFENLLGLILKEFAWVLDLEKRFPDRIFTFFAHSVSKDTLKSMEDFLSLDHDAGWVKDVLNSYKLNPVDYPITSHEVDLYKAAISRLFSRDKDVLTSFQGFLNTP